MPTAQMMLPAKFQPVGRSVFWNIPIIRMVISIMGWINESFVRLMAITAFSSISPRTLGIFARGNDAYFLGLSFLQG